MLLLCVHQFKGLELKQNKSDISGVLLQGKNKLNYNLRRYFSEGRVSDLVEQYWFVDWTLAAGQEHLQQNLPDPNFHLVFENGSAKLVGPVSKVFSYSMKHSGKVLGVKFKSGALAQLLPEPMTSFVNREVCALKYFGALVGELAKELNSELNDDVVFQKLQSFLIPFAIKPLQKQLAVTEQLELIKSSPDILSVQQLATRSNTSARTLQRDFTKYLGLSPKWLIRKYRLHQALSELEKQETTIHDLVIDLGYTDQSHLIRDFKDILGVTPQAYKSEALGE